MRAPRVKLNLCEASESRPCRSVNWCINPLFGTFLAVAMLAGLPGCCHSDAPRVSRAREVFDVRDFGACGDGKTLDTTALNAAVAACAKSPGGRVFFPPGIYLTGTVRLRSNVTLDIDPGAQIVGTSQLDRYENFTPPSDALLPEPRWHRAVLLGEGVHDVHLTGRGTISGGNVTDPRGEENVRGPHAVLFANSRNVSVSDVTLRDAGNYALFFEFTDHVDVRRVTITGGYDGVHLRGWIGRPCRDVRVADCEFYTGDDCVAGWYWQDVLVESCVMNSASNGFRLFGPARHVTVRDCRMFGPGKYEWRTSGVLHHKSMAAGLCIQPSAWGDTPGVVDDVRVSNVTMSEVTTPLHLACRSPSTIGRVSVDRLTATGVYRAAMSVESWASEPVKRFDLRDARIEFVGGFGPLLADPAEVAVALLTAQSSPDSVKPPGLNPRPLPCWGLYARNVASLKLSNVSMSLKTKDNRPPMILEGIRNLDLSHVQVPPEAAAPVMRNVGNFTRR
jgi:hypothetical protein